jgi:hypothetical protein
MLRFSESRSLFKTLPTGLWLIPVITATQETEIRIAVRSQSRQIAHQTLHQKYPTQNRAGGKWQTTCLASPRLNSNPVLPKRKNSLQTLCPYLTVISHLKITVLKQNLIYKKVF